MDQSGPTQVNVQEEPCIDQEELRKALEWELSLDVTDLRSHAWFHGTIPRPRAEELLVDDGNFLIRDCISQPGDYVLTCRCKGAPLHFVINKVIQQPNTVYEKIQFTFEDDFFDTVPDLVTYYVGNKNPISAASGAIICKPINRSMPLSYYATRYGLQCQMNYSPAGQEKAMTTPSVESLPAIPPDLPHKTGYFSLDRGFTQRSEEAHNMLRKSPSHPESTFHNENSEVVSDKPPPKPSRISVNPQGKLTRIHVYCEPSYDRQSSTSSLESNPTPTQFHSETFPRLSGRKASGETRFSFLDRASVSSDDAIGTPNIVSEEPKMFTIPDLIPETAFNIKDFCSPLLAVENKPLEMPSMLKVRSLIGSSCSKVLANHLTKVDMELLKSSQEYNLGLGVVSGLELITLPQGMQLCGDLIERSECLKLFIGAIILTSGSETERAEMLNKWIQVAVDTKTALGNLYGFTAIMMALAMPQVSRLKSTWLTLRRLHTETALLFETKLRPTLKSMQECNNPQAPNTSIPYLLSLVTILQKHLDMETSQEQEKRNDPASLGLPWEQTAADYGLQLLLSHLENGRHLAQDIALYRRSSEIVMENVKLDSHLMDMFRTEFHRRFLWGSKGALVNSCERHAKFSEVLTVMSEKCEA